jgi:hypothetical protein
MCRFSSFVSRHVKCDLFSTQGCVKTTCIRCFWDTSDHGVGAFGMGIAGFFDPVAHNRRYSLSSSARARIIFGELSIFLLNGIVCADLSIDERLSLHSSEPCGPKSRNNAT